MRDTIYRDEAIKAIEELRKEPYWMHDGDDYRVCGLSEAGDAIEHLPSADRPQGEVDAVEIYESAERRLERGEITLGDFEKTIEPLRHLFYGRPQGEWIVTTLYASGEEPKIAVRCSECKKIPLWLGSPILPTKSGNLLEYCPHCGCRMKGADNDTD